MKKRSLLTAVLSFSLVANIFWLAFHLVKVANDYDFEVFANVERSLSDQFTQFRGQFKDADSESLQSEISNLQKYHAIDFAFWQDGGEQRYLMSAPKFSPDFNFQVDGKLKLLSLNNQPEGAYVGETWGSRTVIFGKFFNLAKEQATYLRASRGNIFWLLGGNLAIILFLLIYYFRDFFKLVKAVRKGGSAQAVEALRDSKFSETQAVAMVFTQARAQVDEAMHYLRKAQDQILPSLLSELKEARALPYEFESFLVRVDINGSTAAFSKPELKQVQDYWFNRFFFLSSEVVNRYGGYFHEVIGDEIIFYLKVTDTQDRDQTAKLAIACVRDIFLLAQDIDQEIWNQFQFHFKIKAALDFGSMKVGEGFRGLRIAGLPPRNILVSTSRMLDFEMDKASNQFVLPRKWAELDASGIQRATPILQIIPGIEDDLQYDRVSEFSLLDLTAAPSTLFFRSDEDLKKVLVHLCGLSDETSLLAWIRCLGAFKVLSLRPEVAEQAVQTLESLAQKTNRSHATSAFVMAIVKLVPAHQLPPGLDAALLKLMVDDEDVRVQANAIEAWGLLGKDLERIDQNFKFWKHHRSLANAIVLVLAKKMDPRYLKLMKKMLESTSPVMQASCCYALEMIAVHYTKTDALLLKTNADLKYLLIAASKLEFSDSAMVANRSRALVKKLRSA